MDGPAIYHKMSCNPEFIFIHSNQSENAKVVVTFENRIYGKKERKKSRQNPIPRIFFLFLSVFSAVPKIVMYMKEVMHFSQD